MRGSFRAKVSEFWKYFDKKEPIIREMIDKNIDSEIILAFTESILKTAFSDINFQLGVNINNKYELILSPQGDRVKLLLYYYWWKQAPTSLLKKWSIYPSKPALADTNYKLEMFGISIEEADITLYPSINKKSSRVELCIYCPKLDSLSDSHRYSIIFAFLDQYIGEQYSIEHIGNIQCVKERLRNKQVSISYLKKFIDQAMTKQGWIHNANPISNYMSYKINPNVQPGWILREDIAFGYSSCTAPISTYHFKDNDFFYKYRKQGVIFGFLFYDNSVPTNEEQISIRAAAENRIIKELSNSKIADCIGAGVGIKYSYLDFIIYDFEYFLYVVKDYISIHHLGQFGFNYFRSDSEPIILQH